LGTTTVIGRLGKAVCAFRLPGATSKPLAANRMRRERRMRVSSSKNRALSLSSTVTARWHLAPRAKAD
jgi:hypothetical protein